MIDHTLIIAEAGVNHNGDINRAKELVKAASDAGADFVKFQTFKADKLVSKRAKKAAYQKKNFDNGDDSQYTMLKSLELSDEQHRILIEECSENNIKFLSTAFDAGGIDFLDSLGLPFFKCPSGEITNYPYLKHLAGKRKPVILSTGMATMPEIKEAMHVLCEFGLTRDQITVLHCNTEYPTPMGDVNLKAMNTIAKELGVRVGYSDHTLGTEVPIAAVALGACVIEKHFTLSRNLPGPDHRASLEPEELKKMVEGIRNIEKAISGTGMKAPSESEIKNREIARKSIFSSRRLKKGVILCDDDLIPLRPGNGISPMEWKSIIGRQLTKDMEQFEQLKWEFLS